MLNRVTLKDLNPAFAREYVSSQDPDISLRYVIPIPNWLENNAPIFDHPQIKQIEKKGTKQWRFLFLNHKDNAEQGVKIDGTGAIILMGITEELSKKVTSLIKSYISKPDDLTPEIVSEILDKTYTNFGINDRFNKDIESLEQHFHSYNADDYLGGFLPKFNQSVAIYIAGEGEFLDGPTLTPQKFANGAFINFPGQRLTDSFQQNALQRGRLVQADTFIKDRTLPDGTVIDVTKIPQQRFEN